MREPRPILIDLPDQLTGPRVVLRPWRDADAQALFALVDESREHVRRWLPWPDEYHSIDDARAYVRREAARWITRENFAMGLFDRDGNLLGSAGLHPHDWRVPAFEIGYWLGASHQGKGYMTEAVRIVTALAFDLMDAQRVIIRCDAENERSANVARRCGFVFEGTFRSDHRDPEGNLWSTMVFSRLPDDSPEAD